MNRRNFLKLVGGAVVCSTSPQPTDATARTEFSKRPIEDMAFGRPVKVSSTAYAPTPGALAVDGSRMSWWTSAPQDPAWIQVDLQARCIVERIALIFPHKAGDPMPQTTRWTPADVVLGSYPIRFTVALSLDGKRWKTVFRTESGVGGELNLKIDRQPARYVRLICKQRSWTNYGLAVSSLEVYGACAVERPPAAGWTAPRVARKTNGPALPPNADGELVGGWNLEMIGPGGTRAEGADVSNPYYNSRSWCQAVVPGTVLTTLVEQGVFPDPLFGLNNLQIPEALNKYSWWYRKTFKLPASYQNRRVWLHFDGINYTAEVWLNRHRIGEIRGAFTRGIFDITETVKRTGVNALAVKVNPVPHPGLPDEQSWSIGAGPNGGQPTRDGPNFFCTVGWDWIPGIRDRCTGIWSGVHLSTSGAVTLRNPHVKAKLPLPDTSSATLSVTVEAANGISERVEGVLIGRIGDIEFRRPVSLEAGQTKTIAFEADEFPQLVIKDPHLWWPNGYGQPHLYQLELAFEIGGRTSDSVNTRFGIRQFEYEKSPELIIKCNDHKIMCRGGDWGLDEAMKRLPARRMEAWIRLHHLANLNIIRNWTGESNSEEFFAQCDKYGIMVWTEFWMANPGDGPNPDDAALLLANAEDTIKRYRNHPSIVVWCGRNEGPPPPDINDALLRMTTDLDGTRYYQPGSSFAGVQSGGPYSFRESATYFKPYFDGFKTEIGSVSVPTLDSLRMAIPEEQLWPPHNDTWAYHDYCVAGASYIPSYEAAMQRRFGPTSNIEDFVKRAQMLNYEVYRGIFEGYLSKLWNHASGVILWMSHPAQRSTVWQLYAHDLEAHASLYGAKKGCEPIHIQLSPVDFSVDLINHNLAEIPDITVAALVYNLDGSLAKKTTKTINAAANQKTAVFTLHLPETLTEVYFVRLTVHAFDGALIADNFYWQGSRSGDLQAMNRMPMVRPEGRVNLIRNGEAVIATVKLRNASKTPAIAIKLTPRKDGVSGPFGRILPAFISDNYFSLMPGESKTVTAELHAKDIGEHRVMIEIGGWNIAPQTVSAEGGRFISLAAAAPAYRESE